MLLRYGNFIIVLLMLAEFYCPSDGYKPEDECPEGYTKYTLTDFPLSYVLRDKTKVEGGEIVVVKERVADAWIDRWLYDNGDNPYASDALKAFKGSGASLLMRGSDAVFIRPRADNKLMIPLEVCNKGRWVRNTFVQAYKPGDNKNAAYETKYDLDHKSETFPENCTVAAELDNRNQKQNQPVQIRFIRIGFRRSKQSEDKYFEVKELGVTVCIEN